MIGPLLAGARETVARGLFRLPPPVLRRLAGPPVVVDGKTLDPEMQLLLRLERFETPLEALPMAKARRQVVAAARLVGGRPPIGAVTERRIDGPGGPLALRFYLPRQAADLSAALVYLHGGGWMYGDLDSHDALCRVLAEQAGVRVIAVDYRRSPEAPFPAAVDDAWTAWRWVHEHGVDLGLDPDRIAVGGDSAGGNLAAVVAQRAARERVAAPAFQLLIYPGTVFGQATRSRELFGQGFHLTQEYIDRAEDHYLVGGEDLADPWLSPLLQDPTGAAPAHVVTAGFDPLLDEGAAYADLLREHGVPVDYVCEEGLIHAFANMTGLGRSAPAAVARIAAALRRALH